MQSPTTYFIDQNILSISERLKLYVTIRSSNHGYIDKGLVVENLQYNLAFLLSHIILNLTFADRSKEAFVTIINEYNVANTTGLQFEDFEKLHWIRIMNNMIMVPSVVSHFIWQVGHNQKEGTPIDIPKGKDDLIKCLQIFHEKSFEESYPSIPYDSLVLLLKDYGTQHTTIEFLVQRKILGLNEITNRYVWKAIDYSRHLGNEISAILYTIVCGPEPTEDLFRKYLQLVYATNLWPRNLGNYLTPQDTAEICKLSIAVLSTEVDLENTGGEIEKSWLDYARYSHVTIKDEAPKINLSAQNTIELIDEMGHHTKRFHELFMYPSSRAIYRILVTFIMQFDKHPVIYRNVFNLLKAVNKPYLVWDIYLEIIAEFPEVIPHLLRDSVLAPLAFKALDKVQINSLLLSDQDTRNETHWLEKYELMDTIWLELFEITLNQIVVLNWHKNEQATILASILDNAVHKVYKSNGIKTTDGIAKHQCRKKRYETALRIFANKRNGKGISLSGPYIHPKIAPTILSHVYDSFNKRKKFPWYTEILTLDYATMDLGIELMRIANIHYAPNEISIDTGGDLQALAKKITTDLISELLSYYVEDEIEVQMYSKNELEKRRAKRIGNYFGCEIVDWGYLFLNMQRFDELSTFDLKVQAKIKLDAVSSEGIYTDSNQEQHEIITHHLKTLMLGFIGISKRKQEFEYENLPVVETLRILESLIQVLAEKFSINDLPANRIDVFSESNNFFGNYLYQESMTVLLYKCVDLFEHESRKIFVDHFFLKSKDLGQMLTAFNILESIELREIISNRIKNVDIEDFIKSSTTVIDLERTLIQAINSDVHWREIAEPLIMRVQEHFEHRQYRDENSENVMYEIKLVLAFKKNDLSALEEVELPPSQMYPPQQERLRERKEFFIAAFRLYTEKDFDKAIYLFQALLSHDPKNATYAFHLYRAKTLKALNQDEPIFNQ